MNSAQSSILVELNISGRDRVPASEARRRRAVLPVDRRPSAVRPGPIRSRGSARYPQFVKFGPTTSRGPQGVRRILSYINDLAGTALPRDVEWEPAFEVCFYRDLWHLQGRKGKPHSPKRTFDLCLFSEDAIVILEAKAQQAFEAKQLERFKSDCKEVKAITGVGKVWLFGLASSRYKLTPSVSEAFGSPLLTWRDLAEIYGDDPVLKRADKLYDPEDLGGWGKNNDGGHVSGGDLMAAHRRGEIFCVGRSGGLSGAKLLDDLRSGNWRTHTHETTRTDVPPNGNWFRLSEFAKAVETQGADE